MRRLALRRPLIGYSLSGPPVGSQVVGRRLPSGRSQRSGRRKDLDASAWRFHGRLPPSNLTADPQLICGGAQSLAASIVSLRGFWDRPTTVSRRSHRSHLHASSNNEAR